MGDYNPNPDIDIRVLRKILIPLLNQYITYYFETLYLD